VHPTQIAHGKHRLQKKMPEICSARRAKHEHDQEAFQAQFYQQIGQLKVELDWVKTKLDLLPEGKRAVIEPDHPHISIARQCDLVGLPRSRFDSRPQGESAENLHLLRLLDEQYTLTPYYGVRRMTAWLRSEGDHVHHNRVARLMQTMGIEAIYPKPHLSQIQPLHRVYPYLLRGIPITHVHHVWSTDITSIRLHGGFIYLVAVMDWFSRYGLSWAVSITMDVGFCLEALDQALEVAQPEIVNRDQGAQFTSLAFTGRLAAAGIQMSMDGRGRALDNVFVERLWRTVKYEEVYWKAYETPREAIPGLATVFVRYNERRQHQALDYRTPAAVYFDAYV
jgi:putative transposase